MQTETMTQALDAVLALRDELHDPPNSQPVYADGQLETLCRSYSITYEIVKMLQPKSIFEIGVNAGYYARMMCAACDEVLFTGIDLNQGTHGGRVDYYKHAERLLSSYNAHIIIGDSKKMPSLIPDSELLHVDGDHTHEGCMNDLMHGFNCSSCKWVLVDDVYWMKGVRSACDEFAHWSGWQVADYKVQPVGEYKRALGKMLFTRV